MPANANGAGQTPRRPAAESRSRLATSSRALARGAVQPVARDRMRPGQRLRLVLAMIDAVGQDGYRDALADVIARAGVLNLRDSTRAVRQQAGLPGSHLRRGGATPGSWPLEQLDQDCAEAAISALFAAARENAGGLRLEIPPPGPWRTSRAFSRVRAVHPRRAPVRARRGVGIRHRAEGDRRQPTACSTEACCTEEGSRLDALVDLARWPCSTRRPRRCSASRPRAPRARRAKGSLNGGRAPGTLAPHPPLAGRAATRGPERLAQLSWCRASANASSTP